MSNGENIENLRKIDEKFEKCFEDSPYDALDKLYEFYEENKYMPQDEFFEQLYFTTEVMKRKKKEWLKLWWNNILYGSVSKFNMSLEIYNTMISLADVEVCLNEVQPTKEEILRFYEGLLLFTIDDKKIVNLIFVLATYIRDKELIYNYCIENVYANYRSALLEVSDKYAACQEEFRTDLAIKIVKHYEENKEKIELGYNDKDFIPPIDRQLIYYKFQHEQMKMIHKMAEERSVFANIFPSRKMKYGKKIAFIQNLSNEEKNYSVSGYMEHSFSAELPRDFINYPVEFVSRRREYLERRKKNEVNN